MVPAAPRDSPCRSDNTGIGLDPVQGEEFIDNLLGCHNKVRFPSKFLSSRSQSLDLAHCAQVLNCLSLANLPRQVMSTLSSTPLGCTWGRQFPPPVPGSLHRPYVPMPFGPDQLCCRDLRASLGAEAVVWSLGRSLENYPGRTHPYPQQKKP